ncbi:MAG TPA: RNA polymerase factor sigma-54 [Beijerinckiaceae bacterium]|nr:RNA polymerase factor sigma-54 [Beijerinckiaceae bacterium]
MAIAPKLVMRQSQSLVMTPQLLQAIKLLQLSTSELSAFVEAELERNPMLERADSEEEAPFQTPSESVAETREEGDWALDRMPADRQTLERDLGTELENAFPDDAPPTPAASVSDAPADSPFWDVRGGGGGIALDGDDPNLEAYLAASTSLAEHLHHQLAETLAEGTERLIGAVIIEAIDPTGYLAEPLSDIARRLGVSIEEVEAVLGIIQGFEPSGIGARSLAECLAIQLRERDRFDPAMQVLVGHLDLLAKRDFAGLRRLCQVDEEDLADMVREIRALDPKPGLAFSAPPAEPVVPDVIVRSAPDGSWRVDLNSEALPRVIANRSYYARISRDKEMAVRSFADEAWSNATWIVRSLEQRARTVLKVATEIVRQQDGFFAYGVAHLRPLNLKTIADAVQMHESTISRVTANKFMATPRGLFEMKYFFTTAIASADGGEAYSAEAVRHRIRQMIEAEAPDRILSDDAIVDALRSIGIDIARRTVAKYREAMHIPSSSVRRREKSVARASL